MGVVVATGWESQPRIFNSLPQILAPSWGSLDILKPTIKNKLSSEFQWASKNNPGVVLNWFLSVQRDQQLYYRALLDCWESSLNNWDYAQQPGKGITFQIFTPEASYPGELSISCQRPSSELSRNVSPSCPLCWTPIWPWWNLYILFV